MDKFLSKVNAITQKRYLQVLMNGFIGISAISIAGSLFTLVKSIPFDPWLKFLASSGLGAILAIPVSITTDLIALYVVISMAYHMAKSFDMDGFAPSLVALGSFLLVTPFQTIYRSLDPATNTMVATVIPNVIPMSAIGAQGLFLAIFSGLVAARLYIFCIQKGFKISMPDSVPENVAKMFEAMIPGGIVFLVFLGIRYGMSLTPYLTAQSFIYGLFQAPLSKIGGGLPGVILYVLIVKLFWSAGVHGGMMAYVGMGPIITLMATENASAFAAGVAAPHPEWILGTFVAGIGILALTVLMVSPLAKSTQYKALSKIALPTSLFGITEPIMFGTPIILNPIYLIPFILSPIISLFVSLGLMNVGLVAWPTGAAINQFMPFGFFGAFLNGSWTGVLLSVILLAVNIALYYPFFTYADRTAYKKEQIAKNQ